MDGSVPTAADLMTRELVTLTEGDTLESARRYLELAHVRHLPVVRRGKLVGLLTQRDLLRAAGMAGGKVDHRPVKEVMVRHVLTIHPDTPLREAVRSMLREKYGCLPVVEADGTLVGIITESDLLKFAEQRLEELERQALALEYRGA